MARRLFRIALPLVVLSVVPTSTPGGEPLSVPDGFDHVALDTILRSVVVDERVDYRLLRDRHSDTLERYLHGIARLDPSGLARDDRLAFYINLYNASMLRAVVQRYRPGYSVEDDEFAVFHEPLVRVAGRRVSLDQLEHEIIRPEFSEPRVHVALVCAARSCPPLISRAYTGDALEQILDGNMRRFLSDSTRNRIDVATRTLELSRLFEWYADDFGGADRVSSYVDRYTDADVTGFSVRFLPYSWELNDFSP